MPILPSVTQGFCCLSAGLSGDRGTCPVQEPRRCPCFAPLSPRGGGTWGAASRHPRALSPAPVHPSTRGGGPAGLGDSSGTAGSVSPRPHEGAAGAHGGGCNRCGCRRDERGGTPLTQPSGHSPALRDTPVPWAGCLGTVLRSARHGATRGLAPGLR